MGGKGHTDQSKLDGLSNQNKSNIPTRKPKLPAVLTPENIDKAYHAVRNTGEISAANIVLNTTSSTILKWRKKFPEFGQSISEALKDHKILMDAKHPEYFVMAMSTLRRQLEDREMEDVTITEEQIIDEKTHEIVATKRKKRVRKYIREPNWKAIEKVIDRKVLQKALFTDVKERLIRNSNDIISHLFGNWINVDGLGREWDGNLFNPMVDLMINRTLQAETKDARDNGELSIKEYSKLVQEQAMTFNKITQNLEKGPSKLLKGKSYNEMITWFQKEFQENLKVIEEVVNDVKIERSQIMNEAKTRISKLTEVSFTAWLNIQKTVTY